MTSVGLIKLLLSPVQLISVPLIMMIDSVKLTDKSDTVSLTNVPCTPSKLDWTSPMSAGTMNVYRNFPLTVHLTAVVEESLKVQVN